MVVDYCQMVYRFIMLDANPLLMIKELVYKVALYKICSNVDSKPSYHQVLIFEKKKKKETKFIPPLKQS